MSPFITAELIVGSMCLAVGLLHLLIYFRRPESKVDLFFALMSLCVAGAAFVEIAVYRATSVDAYATVLKWLINIQGVQWAMLAWFIYFYTGTTRRWQPIAVSAAYAVAVMVNIVSPYGVLFSGIDELFQAKLAWGEQITYAIGPPNRWRFVADAGWILLMYLAVDSCIRLARAGDRRRAALFGLNLFVFLGLSYLHGTLIDLGIVGPPPLHSFAFLGLVLVTSSWLTGEVVRASKLSREVAENERRLRRLLENVRLLVARLDGEGCIDYVNPHFLTVSGYRERELLGKSILSVVPETEREDIEERLRQAKEGFIRHHAERPLLRKDGAIRHIHWSHTLMPDSSGDTFAILSIGEDVTERKELEMARNRALKEIGTLKLKLEEENVYLKEEILQRQGFNEIVGESKALLYVLSRIEQVADTDATVLVLGETGVGKELVARAVHRAGRRSNQPFIHVNCAALPVSLVESELFGHEAGAFTGAERQRKGRFELADGGTVFLDEVSEMSLEVQVKLLRVLQEGQLERVGGTQTMTVDVRVIAASNRNLQDEIAAGRFRADLFYRLNVYPITVPPLRKRKEDIPLLVQHFVSKIAKELGRSVDQIPAAVLEALSAYDWPGNIRELRNVLERALITSSNGILYLPERIGEGKRVDRKEGDDIRFDTLESVERNHITGILESTGWRISGPKGAAGILGLNPSTLRFRMKKLGISRKKG